MKILGARHVDKQDVSLLPNFSLVLVKSQDLFSGQHVPLRPSLLRSGLLRHIIVCIRSGLLRSSLLNLVFLGPASSVFRLYLLRPDLLRPSFLMPVVYFSLHLSEFVHLIGRQNAYTRSLQLLTVFYSRLYATLQKQQQQRLWPNFEKQPKNSGCYCMYH